jgi:hypothetical protein
VARHAVNLRVADKNRRLTLLFVHDARNVPEITALNLTKPASYGKRTLPICTKPASYGKTTLLISTKRASYGETTVFNLPGAAFCARRAASVAPRAGKSPVADKNRRLTDIKLTSTTRN